MRMEGCREGESLQKNLLTKNSTSIPNCASETHKQIESFREGLMGKSVQNEEVQQFYPLLLRAMRPEACVCQAVRGGSSLGSPVSAGEAFGGFEQICMIYFSHDKMISEIEQNNLWSHSLSLLAYPHSLESMV